MTGALIGLTALVLLSLMVWILLEWQNMKDWNRRPLDDAELEQRREEIRQALKILKERKEE